MKAIALGLSISFTGIPSFKKSQALRDLAAELPADRLMVETDAPIWRPASFAASATNLLRGEIAKVLAEARGSRSRRFRVRPPLISFGCSAKCRLRKRLHDADAHNSRLRILCRRSAPRAGLGRVRSRQPEKPPPPLLAAGGAGIGSRHDQVLIDTSPDLREQLIDAEVDHSMRYSSPMSTPIKPTASTISARSCCISAGASRSISINRPPNISCCGFHTASSRRRAATIRRSSTITRSKPAKAAPSKGRAVRSRSRPFPAARPNSGTRLPDRRCRLYARSQRHSARELASPGKPRTLDHRRAPLCRASQPFQRQRRAVVDRALQAAPGVITNMHSDLDYEVLRQSLPPDVVPAYDGMRLTLERTG